MSGVPQGSVLGPFLYLIYVTDLPDLLQGDALQFADEVKVISARARFHNLHTDGGLGFDLGPSFE